MNLDHDLQQAKLSGKREFREWRSLPLERFWEQSNPSNGVRHFFFLHRTTLKTHRHRKTLRSTTMFSSKSRRSLPLSETRHLSLLPGHHSHSISDTEDKFSRKAVKRLVDLLEAEPLSHLSAVEHAHLVGLIQTTVEVRCFRRDMLNKI